MNQEREFEKLYKQTEGLLRAMPEIEFKTATAYMVVIGWLLTSLNAQTFIAKHGMFIAPCIYISFSVLIILQAGWIKRHYRLLLSSYRQLISVATKNNIVSEQSLAVFKLGIHLPISYVIINTILCMSIMAIVYLLALPQSS